MTARIFAPSISAWSALLLTIIVAAAGASAADLPVHTFDQDPGWEKFGKTAMGGFKKEITQDFGWRSTNKAGGAGAGEIGGTISRSFTPAVYWTKIPQTSLNDKISFSGRFAVLRTDGDSSVHFGFFNESSAGWRTPNSLVFRLSGENKKEPAWAQKVTGQFSWAFADIANRNWKASGIGAFDGNVYQKTMTPPVRSDGKPHDFSVDYDPAGGGGLGEISVTLDGKTWKQPLEKDVKAEGAIFNRFGIMNIQVSGSSMEFYLDDLKVNGEPFDFAKDPGWEARGNHITFQDHDARPHHDLRWQKTATAGGEPGEIAITMWRDENPAYYADKVGPLTLDQELHAQGRLAFTGAGSDSGVGLGWFNSAQKRAKSTADYVNNQRSLLGIVIEGPSRIGHYFRPVYSGAADGMYALQKEGPIIRPDGKQRRWTLDYDPAAADGNGRVTVTLDGEKTEMDLKPGVRSSGVTFDRFGFFDLQSGGHYVKIFIDDVKYTAKPAGQAEAR